MPGVPPALQNKTEKRKGIYVILKQGETMCTYWAESKVTGLTKLAKLLKRELKTKMS